MHIRSLQTVPEKNFFVCVDLSRKVFVMISMTNKMRGRVEIANSYLPVSFCSVVLLVFNKCLIIIINPSDKPFQTD